RATGSPGFQSHEKVSSRAVPGMFAAALAPAALIVDWDTHPRQYLERLIVVLRAQASLLHQIEQTDARWKDANDRIGLAMKHVSGGESEIDWWEAFYAVKQALAA